MFWLNKKEELNDGFWRKDKDFVYKYIWAFRLIIFVLTDVLKRSVGIGQYLEMCCFVADRFKNL